MKRPPLTHADILEAIARNPPRRDKRLQPPWIDADLELELYVSPAIKARFGLKCKTTVEYLASLQPREEDA